MEIMRNDLMVRFNAGDRNAFDIIYNQFHDSLYYFARRLTDNEQGKDITIETFLKLWERRGKFETLNNVKAFLFITAKNACLLIPSQSIPPIPM